MAWSDSFVVLPSGQSVRFTLFLRGDTGRYFIRFVGPNGKRVKETTDAKSGQKPRAMEEAKRIILTAYCPTEFNSAMTWDEAEEKLVETLKANGRRDTTIKGYIETINAFRRTLPSITRPGLVTNKHGEQFKKKYGKNRDGKDLSPVSLDSRLRSLSAVFGWYKEMNIVTANPFEQVERPKLDKPEVKHVSGADVEIFFNWLEERWAGWELVNLLFKVKLITGCRLADLTAIRSDWLQDGRIVFPPSLTKARKERRAKMPESIYARLLAIKGESYLWENFPTELRPLLQEKGNPTHRLNSEFSPRRLYLWIVAEMRDFNKKHPTTPLTSHDFRRAAFTKAWEAGIEPTRAAIAYGINPQTMMKHYVSLNETEIADDVMDQLNDESVSPKTLPRNVARRVSRRKLFLEKCPESVPQDKSLTDV